MLEAPFFLIFLGMAFIAAGKTVSVIVDRLGTIQNSSEPPRSSNDFSPMASKTAYSEPANPLQE